MAKLPKNKPNFMLEQRRASMRILRQQRLAKSNHTLIRMHLSQRKHSSVPVKQPHLWVQQHLGKVPHILVSLISLWVEGRGGVVSLVLQGLHVEPLSLAVLGLLSPLGQVKGQLAGFLYYDVVLVLVELLEEVSEVVFRDVSEGFYSFVDDNAGVGSIGDDLLEEGFDEGDVLFAGVHLA